jgi:hypothetical protein
MNENKQAPHLNWCGWPIKEGDFGYGGRNETIVAPKRDRREVITEADVAAIFKDGALTKAEAARRSESSTGAHWASCYRALAPVGRFAKHLHFEADMVRWRKCAT